MRFQARLVTYAWLDYILLRLNTNLTPILKRFWNTEDSFRPTHTPKHHNNDILYRNLNTSYLSTKYNLRHRILIAFVI